jgi:hypothetical protein
MKQITQMKRNHISVEPKVRNLCTSVPSVVKRTVTREPQITRMKRMPQMNRNSISVEPKVRNLRTSVLSVVKRTVARGTADYTDETDTADEEKPHRR